MQRKIALGADHRGFNLKENIKKNLEKKGFTAVDFGTNSTESVDYPKISLEVALAVSKRKCSTGILICGSGIGMAITANKIKGIRAALCHNTGKVRMAREHNDANILVLGAKAPKKTVNKMVDLWLKAKFHGGRHQRRINQLKAIERRYLK